MEPFFFSGLQQHAVETSEVPSNENKSPCLMMISPTSSRPHAEANPTRCLPLGRPQPSAITPPSPKAVRFLPSSHLPAAFSYLGNQTISLTALLSIYQQCAPSHLLRLRHASCATKSSLTIAPPLLRLQSCRVFHVVSDVCVGFAFCPRWRRLSGCLYVIRPPRLSTLDSSVLRSRVAEGSRCQPFARYSNPT